MTDFHERHNDHRNKNISFELKILLHVLEMKIFRLKHEMSFFLLLRENGQKLFSYVTNHKKHMKFFYPCE